MITLTLAGKTYSIKEELKAEGFRWNPTSKVWQKNFDDSESDRVERLANAYIDNGVLGTVTRKADPSKVEKHYMVKESWIFNLESMDDKCWVIAQDIREGKIQLPIKIAGRTINSEDDVWAIRDEADELRSKAWSSKGVTGKEYGRIKEIVGWRVEVRYANCMASGMSESDAGRCFEDM